MGHIQYGLRQSRNMALIYLCLLSLVSLSASISAQATGEPPVCRSGFVHLHDGYCYAYVKDLRKWEDAQAHCKALNATLAEPRSLVENIFVEGVMLENRALGNVWLGGHDRITEGHWEWASNGDAIVKGQGFTDWERHNPSGGHGSHDHVDCMAMNGGLHQWIDEPCAVHYHSICQYVAPAPTPD